MLSTKTSFFGAPQIDTDQLWKFTTLERCVRYHLQQQERYWRIIAPAASAACGRRHEQSLVLIDMDGGWVGLGQGGWDGCVWWC